MNQKAFVVSEIRHIGSSISKWTPVRVYVGSDAELKANEYANKNLYEVHECPCEVVEKKKQKVVDPQEANEESVNYLCEKIDTSLREGIRSIEVGKTPYSIVSMVIKTYENNGWNVKYYRSQIGRKQIPLLEFSKK